MARLTISASRIWVRSGVVLEDASITCEDAVIVEVREGAPRLAAGEHLAVHGFLLPAAADRHVHIGLSDAVAVLRAGVTAVRDLAWPVERILPMAQLSETPAFEGPLIRAAGPMITAPGGYPTRAGWAPEGTGLEVTADGAAAAIDDLAERGVAAIKVSLNAEAGPTPDDATLLAIVDAAHRHDLPVTAHAQGAGQVERALGAGIDELAHTPWTRLPDDVVSQAAQRLRFVSTLDILSFGADTPELRTALDNLRRFLAAGGEVVYGTDLGNGSIPPGIHVRELLLLREAGLDPDGVLGALTRAPLEAGAPADLIVLAADPLEDLHAFERIAAVFRGGIRVT